MALETRRISVSSIRRFPQDVREELNKFLHRSSWQCLTREFSVDVFTGLQPSALDGIVNLVDSSYPEFQKDVESRLELLKNTMRGTAQCFKGKSEVGFHSYFYRFWLVGQKNADGLYDIVFCHISRKEEFDFFRCLTKVMKGGANMLASVPQVFRGLMTEIPQRVLPHLEMGNIQEEEVENARPVARDGGSPYTDLTQDIGDRLTEYELVEDLIERGTLGESADGTLFIRFQ